MITGIVSLQLMQFFMNVGSVSGTFGTMKKIAQIMDTDSEPDDGEPVPEVCADIEFDNVSFAYAGGQDVIKNLSVKIPMGKVTAVIGGNGAGKSTLFKLLLRLYEPKSGEIRFGGDGIGKYCLTDWRDRFAVVSQRNPLIGGTVRENIAYGLDREVSDEELAETARRANCYDYIIVMKDGAVEAAGTPDELLKTNEYYRMFVKTL